MSMWEFPALKYMFKVYDKLVVFSLLAEGQRHSLPGGGVRNGSAQGEVACKTMQWIFQ